jgi:hypothetical protein
MIIDKLNGLLLSHMCCAQDEVPGLQVKMASGEWVVAPPIPGVLLRSQSAQQPADIHGWHKYWVQRQRCCICKHLCALHDEHVCI